GWASLGDVEGALGEWREWGLLVGVPSRWHGSEPYSIAPGAGHLVTNLERRRRGEEQYNVQPRNICVEPFAGNLDSARIERQTRDIPEMVLLARHFALRTRPPLPEHAQARTQKALRQWTYDVDELVRLQVNPGWLHHGESVLTVPAPHPRLDDQSQAALHLLTGDDALSDFLSYLTPLDAADQAPAEAPTLQEAFDDWLRLTTWSELWLAQNEHGLIVRRSLLGAPLAYGEWLNDLARARRFVLRALAVLNIGQWYDFA